MPRVQASDYERRKLAIVELAAALFAERGFEGASLAELGRRGATSKSLIYHYYPTKDEILYDVMSSHVAELNRILDQVEAEGGDAQAKLRKLTGLWLRCYVGAAARHRVLVNELGRLSKARRYVIVAQQRRLLNRVGAYVLELQPQLRQHPRLARPAAMLYFGMINWTHTWLDARGAATPDEVADLAATLFLQGLRGLRRGATGG